MLLSKIHFSTLKAIKKLVFWKVENVTSWGEGGIHTNITKLIHGEGG